MYCTRKGYLLAACVRPTKLISKLIYDLERRKLVGLNMYQIHVIFTYFRLKIGMPSETKSIQKYVGGSVLLSLFICNNVVYEIAYGPLAPP